MSKFFYSRIDENGHTVESKMIDPKRCPHVIFVGEHYRDDGSCKCDDPDEAVMAEWGYTWDGKAWQLTETDTE